MTTPNKAEWASVSPKYDSLLQTIKHPRGPVMMARPIPATKALIRKSSNIIFVSVNGQHFHRVNADDHVHVDKKQE